MVVQFADLGVKEYAPTWELQRNLVALRQRGKIPDTLLLVEHPPTITLGKSAHAENILADPSRLASLGVALLSVDRGGDVTYHGPGQLVAYPILDLQNLKADVLWYVRQLEEVVIQTLNVFKIRAERLPGHTGVWVGDEKIAAIGVHVSRWVTSHGLALNVNTDLSGFDLIIPCGIRDKGVTSMAKILGRQVDMGAVTEAFLAAFGRIFAADLRPISEENLREMLTEASTNLIEN